MSVPELFPSPPPPATAAPPSVISATEPDWSRESCPRWWAPSQQLLKSLRSYQAWRSRGGPLGKLLCVYYNVRHRFWSVASGADIPLNCQIGGGLLLVHPNGVVIHPGAKIGPNCLILQQVTIVNGVEIGGHVDIGAGAKIIRAVTIGDHAKIGANAVVTSDIPMGATAIGIPARVLESEPTPVPQPVQPESLPAIRSVDPRTIRMTLAMIKLLSAKSTIIPVCPECGSRRILSHPSSSEKQEPASSASYECQDCHTQFSAQSHGQVVSPEAQDLVNRLLMEQVSLPGVAKAAKGSERILQSYFVAKAKYDRPIDSAP